MNKMAWLLLPLALCVSCAQQSPPPTTQESIRIASEVDPGTLDPRLARTLTDTTVMRLLYEGLFRVNSEGKYAPAIAKEMHVSDDGLIYTIQMNATEWSDGSFLVADDFVETWKSMLDPSFPCPNASILFSIKGAKEAKEGKAPLDAVGLKVLSPLMFSIEFTKPIVDPMEVLTALPVHPSVRSREPSADPTMNVYNGPFVINSWKHHHQLDFAKNNSYWDSKSVQLEGVTFIVSDEMTALNLYKKGLLDWVGSPLLTLPQDALPSLKAEGHLLTANGDGTYWFRFNTESEPFNDVRVRKAFNLALNRGAIAEHVTQGDQKPALGILPPSMRVQEEVHYTDNQPQQARELLAEVFADLNQTTKNTPSITICYRTAERNHSIAQAVQQQWEKALGIPITLQACEGKVSIDKLTKGDYQIMLGSWFADINDPISFLNVFRSKDNGINNTRWEDYEYATLLDKAELEKDPETRKQILAHAENILMEAMPVAPLFYNTYNYMKSDHVQGVYFSGLGYLDFKNAHIENKNANKATTSG